MEVKMPENQNVLIPLPLFRKILSFFDCLSFGEYVFPAIYDFDGIYTELQAKQGKINLHTAYTNTTLAKSDIQRHQAYANYQKLKNKR
jgi:hypothetical protein